jgi:hypothetical protein
MMKTRKGVYHYRKYGTVKGTHELRVQVPTEVVEFFDLYTHDAQGRKRRPRGVVLEALVEMARKMPDALMECLKKN